MASGITSQSTSNVMVSLMPNKSACEKLESEEYSCVAGATRAVMRKVGFFHEKKAMSFLKTADMMDAMWM